MPIGGNDHDAGPDGLVIGHHAEDVSVDVSPKHVPPLASGSRKREVCPLFRYTLLALHQASMDASLPRGRHGLATLGQPGIAYRHAQG